MKNADAIYRIWKNTCKWSQTSTTSILQVSNHSLYVSVCWTFCKQIFCSFSLYTIIHYIMCTGVHRLRTHMCWVSLSMTHNMQRLHKYSGVCSPGNSYHVLRCVLSSFCFTYIFKITTNWYFYIILQTTKRIFQEIENKPITHFRYHETRDYNQYHCHSNVNECATTNPKTLTFNFSQRPKVKLIAIVTFLTLQTILRSNRHFITLW